MQYAIIQNNTILQYPINIRDALPNTSMRVNWPGGVVDGIEYVIVQSTPRPSYDSATQNIVEGTPILQDGIWIQTWIISDATPEEVTARLQSKRERMTCTPRQARLALIGAGYLPDVTAWVSAAGEATQIEWEYATEVKRIDGLVTTAALALGMTDEQIDSLFALAVTL